MVLMSSESRENVKQKIIEKLKKLSQEEQDKREKIQETKLEGGDSIDNQDYQFNLESLLRIQQQKIELKERLEKLEQLEQNQISTKSKAKQKEEIISLLGKKFKLEVNYNNKSEIIQIEIVSLYEEIEIDENSNIYKITPDSPLAKAIRKYLNEVKDISKLKNIEFILNIKENLIKYRMLENLN
jgi:autotransporter translocation and assembly factor TamB